MEKKYQGLCFFEPWIGENYETGGIFSKKILVVGESHYCGCEECHGRCGFNDVPEGGCENFTRNVIRMYLDGYKARWTATYKKFECSLLNKVTTLEESNIVWNSIAFYNYLQIAMGGPRESGSSHDYKDAEKPFFEVLEELQPDLVIVWGVNQLFNNMPYERWIGGEQLIVDNYPVKNGYYQLEKGKKARVIAIYHPSTGYDWSWWYKVIMSQLK